MRKHGPADELNLGAREGHRAQDWVRILTYSAWEMGAEVGFEGSDYFAHFSCSAFLLSARPRR